jgi:hypothetical protein
MTLGTYWLSGPDETFVHVEGAARRDELAADGWNESAAPGARDQVWVQHNKTQAFAKVPFEGVESWGALGWEPGVPPTRRADLGHQIALPDPQPAPVTLTPESETSEAADVPPADKPRKAATVKENDRA